MRREGTPACLIALLAVVAVGAAGCGTTQAQKKGSAGAAIGAGVGGILCGSSCMLAGGLIGGGAGYLAGDAEDRKLAEQQAARERAAIEKARVTEDPSTADRPAAGNPLVGSTWRVISRTDENDPFEFSAMVVTFQTNSRLTTLLVLPDGKTQSYVEKYRIVGDTVIIWGSYDSGEPYVFEGTFSIANGKMVVATPGNRTVLEEVEEKV